MASIPTKQKTGGAVAKTAPTNAPHKPATLKKPDRLGINPTGGSHLRGKGQK